MPLVWHVKGAGLTEASYNFADHTQCDGERQRTAVCVWNADDSSDLHDLISSLVAPASGLTEASYNSRRSHAL